MAGTQDEPPAPLSRRGFLQAAGSGLALGGVAPGLLHDAPAPAAPRPPAAPASEFALRVDAGAIVGLKHVGDAFDTDYVQAGRRLGDAVVRWRRGDGAWRTLDTADFAGRVLSASDDGARHLARHAPDGAGLELRTEIVVEATAVRLRWELENLADAPLEVGDLALPLPMNGDFRQQPTTAVLKHGVVAGDASFHFWMRRNSVGPYLTLTPDALTHLEYWEAQGAGNYRVFVHSAASGAAARERGTRWRIPHTALGLAPRGRPGSRRGYGVTLRWAADHDGVRRILVEEGLVDVHVVPGMTVPRDLAVRVALRSAVGIRDVAAEHPGETTVRRLGRRGDAELYEVRFARLGENRLTVTFGAGRKGYLEFFCTEPAETLIAKRAAFIAAHQHRDPSRWYDGLLAEWAMDAKKMLGPDDYDRIKGWRVYEVTCDDPGLSKPAFLAAKSAEQPVQAEVDALDHYLERFVWGGLQRTTAEAYPYAVYGIPDWKRNRGSADPGRNGRAHLWRIYDYPHVVLTYFSMYRVARHHPRVRTRLDAAEYLRRAAGTATAMFTVPYEIERWSAYQTGLYNELVIPEVIAALDDEKMRDEADRLRLHWERKVRAFIADRPDLFRSEYAFDTTGFESTHALATYALAHAARLAEERPANERTKPIAPETTRRFLDEQMRANVFCRGWLEPAYWLMGSDIRGSGGNSYTLTYMSQMGGWAVLDYALRHAADFAPYLRLGYASALSSWALLNSGTPESGHGYWFPGPENDGAAGGGFEPAPFGTTWLEQPHHRGSWYYACEIDLGFCGALRCARTVLADDPLFGRVCLGGDWRAAGGALEVIPKDGVRRRFHALLGGRRLHVQLDADRFARARPLVVDEGLRALRFELESGDDAPHATRLRLEGAGRYLVRVGEHVLRATAPGNAEVVVDLPVPGASATVRVEMAD